MTNYSKATIDPHAVSEHRKRVCAYLNRAGADGLFVFRKSNILGLFGLPMASSDRLICGLINRRGDLVFVMPKFESSLADQVLSRDTILTWDESDDPYDAVLQGARKLEIESGCILLDGHTWLDAYQKLMATLPQAKLHSDDGLMQQVRIRKSRHEIAAIRTACGQINELLKIISRLIRPGCTEEELRAEALSEARPLGIAPETFMVQTGPTASSPHARTGARRIAEGDAVIVDIVVDHEGYRGDITRTFAVGQPSPEVLRAYEVVRRAQRSAIEAVRPGVSCESIDNVAREVITDAGLGEFFVHRLGHGIGLDGHEAPYLVQGNKQLLEPGMCVTIEPGVYVPNQFGIRIEDVVAVTDDGVEVLSDMIPTDLSPQFKDARTSKPSATVSV